MVLQVKEKKKKTTTKNKRIWDTVSSNPQGIRRRLPGGQTPQGQGGRWLVWHRL